MLKRKQQLAGFIFGIFLFAGVILPVTVFAQGYEDSPFGIQAPYPQDSLLTNIEATNLLSDVGAKWVRLLPTELEEVAILLSENEIGISSGITPPNGQYPVDMNEHIAEVELIIDEYKDYVKSWQIVNEAELNWNDSEEQYAEYFIEISQVIQSISPDAKVILCLSSGLHELGVNFLDTALTNGVGPYFDVLDFHVQGAEGDYKKIDDAVSEFTTVFQQHGIQEKPFWITEFGTYDGDPDPNYIGKNVYQSESAQASELIKKYIFGLSLNVDKMFWTTMLEWSHYNNPNDYWHYTGLINNPYNPDGYSHKKLSYFTYKKMTEKLEGSDWDNIQTIQKSVGVYVYKFMKQGEPVWVAWNDEEEDKAVILDVGGINSVKVTEAVPKYESGQEVTDYSTAFNTETKTASGGKVTIVLGENPVFVERNAGEINYEDSPFGFNFGYKLSDYVSDLGIKWIRGNAVWGKIQSKEDIENGIYNWDLTEMEWGYNSCPGNTNFLITLSILGTPVSGSGSYIPNSGVYTDTSWINFTKAVVNRYKNRVKYFQVENEPKPYMTDFAEFQQITYNAIKEECPECQVLMGGVFWGKGSLSEWDMLNQQILIDLNGNYVDIFDQHYYGNADEYNPHILLEHARQRLTEANFIETPIWITEMGDYSGDPKEKMGIDPPYQSEQVQAQSLFKRYVSSISYKVEKVFWGWGLFEGFHYDETYFDFTGLIYDGEYDNDLGYGVKKLSYFTYKKTTEKLEGSDWDNITTIIDKVDNKYAYKFINDNTGNPTYIAWWDYFDDPTYTIGDSSLITLTGISSNQVIVTDAVPNYPSGNYISNYNTAFSIDTLTVSGGTVSFYLKENPVFIETISTTSTEETGSITPNEFRLNQNYPNPFNPKTVISFQLPVCSKATLKVYDVLGQEVRTLVNENKSAGYHSVVWDGRDNLGSYVCSGVYFYYLEAGDEFSQTKKLLLIK